MTTALAGDCGRLDVMFVQLAPASVDRYTCGMNPKPLIVAYTVAPLGSCGSAATEETSKCAGLNRFALEESLFTGLSAASVQAVEDEAVLAEVVTKR